MTITEAIEHAHKKSQELKGENCKCANDHFQLALWLEELQKYQEMFTTADGVLVKPDDEVWVNGSCSVSEAHVKGVVTNYELFGPIPVNDSYSSKEAANNAREKWRK